MKTKIVYILILAVIYSLQINFAQEFEHSTGPIPKIKIDTAPIVINNLNDAAWLAYGHESQSSYTISMPIPAGTPFTQLFNWDPLRFASSMAANPPGFYYITETGPPAKLHQMTGLGEVTQVGEIIGMGNEKPNGIAYNSVNESFYIASSTNLYSFDLLNLTANLIGPFNTGGNIIDLCFNEYGVCFAYDVVTDCAYIINISTGEASLLGPLGYDANFGQGMSYDYETQTIYLSAFNYSTFTGQLRTMNPQTGMTTLITDWGLIQLAPFQCERFDIPCIVQGPYNPNPVFGATGVPVTGTSLSWTNSPQTANVEIWFGPIHNVVKVYDGPVISSYELLTLLYNKQYIWRVICKNENCGTPGLIWSFTTMQDPYFLIFEPFNDLSCWTPIGPQGFNNWVLSQTNIAGGSEPELKLSSFQFFTGESKLLSCIFTTPYPNFQHSLTLQHMCDWYADPAPSMGMGITYDSGLTDTILWQFTPISGNVGPELISFNYTPTSSNYQLLLFMNGNSFNIEYWYVDNISVYVDTSVVTVKEESNSEIKIFQLEQNYPNPFNPTTKIKYTIPETGNPLLGGARGGLVTLKVYDILGNEVATLVNEEQQPGVYEIEFHTVGTSRDLSLPSGIYLYQLKAGSYIETKKMILLK